MSTENITTNTAAIAKIKELAEGIDFCFFCSDLQNPPFESSPMSVQEVDEEGNIWFLGSKASQKYENMRIAPQVQLYFADPSSMKYLSIYGEAAIVEDQFRIDQYWNKFVEGWFEKGREDPNIILFKITPLQIHYWDTKHHKLLSYAITLYNAVTGTKNDQGVQGDIDLSTPNL